jgi:hypothetical protein
MHSRKHSRKRIAQPFEVRVDGWHRGAFEEAHDAITSAKSLNENTRAHWSLWLTDSPEH